MVWHKTLVGTAAGPAEVERVVDVLVQDALNKIVVTYGPGSALQVRSVTLTPLTTLGGWPMDIAVTVVAERMLG